MTATEIAALAVANVCVLIVVVQNAVHSRERQHYVRLIASRTGLEAAALERAVRTKRTRKPEVVEVPSVGEIVT